MAKELMEIGGFITSGAEIVNHDNSLSGNGTVESPLGLNETVLFEGSAGAGDTITLSESPMNFERIKVFYGTHARSDGAINATTKDVGIGFTEFMPDETNTIVLETKFMYDPTTQTNAGEINHGVAVYYNTMSTTWTRTISAWSQSWFNGGGTVRTDLNFVHVHKIVGVNRKAQ